MSPFAIFGSLIRFALRVGFACELADMTIAMRKKARAAKKVGQVSLVNLNHNLQQKI